MKKEYDLFNQGTPPPGEGRWLKTEAAKSGVTPDEMARAMLLDAIHDEMDGVQVNDLARHEIKRKPHLPTNWTD